MQNWRGGLPSGKDEGRADGDGAELAGCRASNEAGGLGQVLAESLGVTRGWTQSRCPWDMAETHPGLGSGPSDPDRDDARAEPML